MKNVNDLMMAVFIVVHLFMLALMTLTSYEGHKGVKKLELKAVVLVSSQSMFNSKFLQYSFI